MGDRRAVLRALGRRGRALLRAHAGDAELGRAFEVLRARGFEPPRPVVLETGAWRAVGDRLAQLGGEEREALAGSLMTLPDPAAEPARAEAVMELLVTLPGHQARARELLGRLRGVVPEARRALWAFRMELAGLTDAEALDARLAAVRGATDGPAEVATALRLAASAWLEAHPDAQPGWLVPVLGGRLVVNAHLAARRRPALRDRLSAVYRWLNEASALEPAAEDGTVDGLVLLAATHDRAGRVADGTAALELALTRSGDRQDIAEALAARGQILLSADLVERAAARGGLTLDPETRGELVAVARRPLVAPPRAALEAPRVGWAHRVAELGAEGGARDESDLAFLEAAGSRARAAAGWARRDDDLSMLHAFRLRDALGEDDLGRLIGQLRARVPDDEEVLSDDVLTRELAAALWALTPDGLSRSLQSVRLRAAGGAPAAPPVGETVHAEDPHSPENRLAAASDLAQAGRTEASGAIVAALLKRASELGRDAEGPFLARLLDLAATLLAEERPPEPVVAAALRTLSGEPTVQARLLDVLAARPLAGYAVHEALARLGADRKQPDGVRVRALAAWLAIWRASDTAPDPVTVRDFLTDGAALVALAARRLAGAPDPVGDAAALVAAHPLETTDPEAWASVLAAAARPG